MFDYSTLIPDVRRLISDTSSSTIDTIASTDSASYYIQLTQDGYATPVASGVLIDNVAQSDDSYTVTGSIIKMDTLVPAGSAIVVEYSYVSYTDDNVSDNIGDSVDNVIGPIFNTDFLFGYNADGDLDAANPTITYETVDKDLRALFVYGTAIQILGAEVVEAGGDAIFIKDGDTTIDTAASSREKTRGYGPIAQRYEDLLKIVRINRFHGVIQV